MLESIEHPGGIRELRLNRPPVNALTPELIGALDLAVAKAPDEGARGLVLSGREGLFSAGLDLPHFLTLDRAQTGAAWGGFFGLLRTLASSHIPVAAAMTGHAPAGGCVIGLFCEYRVLAEGGSKIGLNEVQVGVRMPRPIHAAAVRVVGARQAERLCTTAELIDDREALRIGLVDELAPVDQVTARAIAWLERLLPLPPDTLRRTRAVCHEDLVKAFANLDEEQLELFLDEWFSGESQAAMRSVVEGLKKKS